MSTAAKRPATKPARLKPCPWCKRTPTSGYIPGQTGYVECRTKGCPVRPWVLGGNTPAAVRRWNKRERR